MPLANFLSTQPTALEMFINILAILGSLLLAYAVYLEAEKKQDLVFVLGSAALFTYAFWIGNKIFALAMAAIFLISGRELIQIWRGKHTHSTEQ